MSNVERFTGRAESYDRNRQRYDAGAVLPLLRLWCGLAPEWTVADVGAGTGMLAEVFLANGNAVRAVEPNAEMRAVCASLTERWPGLQVLDGTAEAPGLENASVEMVAAGRAFHWFDVPRALVEFRRILKPGGWLALVSLGRTNEASASSDAYERVLLECGMDYADRRPGYRVHERLDKVFARDRQHAEIAGEQLLDWDGLLGQTMSLSVVPTQGDVRFPAFERALREYFERYAEAGVLRMKTTCWVNVGRL